MKKKPAPKARAKAKSPKTNTGVKPPPKTTPFFAPLDEGKLKALYRQHYQTAITKHSGPQHIIPLPPGAKDGDYENPEGSGYFILRCRECGQSMFIEQSPSTAYGYVHGNLQSHIPCTRSRGPDTPTIISVPGD